MKTLKMVHIKKSFKNKGFTEFCVGKACSQAQCFLLVFHPPPDIFQALILVVVSLQPLVQINQSRKQPCGSKYGGTWLRLAHELSGSASRGSFSDHLHAPSQNLNI